MPSCERRVESLMLRSTSTATRWSSGVEHVVHNRTSYLGEGGARPHPRAVKGRYARATLGIRGDLLPTLTCLEGTRGY
eukprot:scaffold27147_cov30-Tisochrysis_lutea.AAC.3